MQPKITIDDLLRANALGRLLGTKTKLTETPPRVKPCRKLLDFSCPVWFEGKKKCFKRGRQGCPFWVQSQLSRHMITYYRNNPQALVTYIGLAIVTGEGVPKGG